MRLNEEARIIRFRGLFLLTTGSKALAVNKSFADVWDIASAGSFTPESLTKSLVARFEISEEEASLQVNQIIENWKYNGLLIFS